MLRLIGLAAARFRELDPAGGDQAIGILDGHLDDAILADGDMPARQSLDGADTGWRLDADIDRLGRFQFFGILR